MADIVDDVMQQVGQRFGVSADEIVSERRARRIIHARHVAVYLAHKLSDMSPRDLGGRFGRDYTNVLMYCRGIERQAMRDDGLRQLLHEMEAAIRDSAHFPY